MILLSFHLLCLVSCAAQLDRRETVAAVELHADGSTSIQASAQKHKPMERVSQDVQHGRLLRRELDLIPGMEGPVYHDEEDQPGELKYVGACVSTHGIFTELHNHVVIMNDNSDCGASVKVLAADLSSESNPLLSCIAKVEADSACSRSFQMVEQTYKCSCMTGAAEADCPVEDSQDTCTYKLIPQACAANTTGIVSGGKDVMMVYQNQFQNGCAHAKTLSPNIQGKNLRDAVQACADSAADDSACSDTFEVDSIGLSCKCVEKGKVCDYVDSATACQYELTQQPNSTA